MTPRERNNAFNLTDHHMFWRAKEYRYASKEANRMRMSSAFILSNTIRWKHDLLHNTIEPLRPPSTEICNTVYDIALATDFTVPQIDQVSEIVYQVAREAAFEPQYKRSDELMAVAFHLASQVGVLKV